MTDHTNSESKPPLQRGDSSRTEIRVLSYVPASDVEQRTGLVGFVCLEYGDLRVDSLVLRRTSARRHALSFPSRTDRAGNRHPYYRPIDSLAREQIEREVLRQLRDLGVATEDAP